MNLFYEKLMVKNKKLVMDFYELKVNQLMDKRIWDLPLIEKNEDIHHVLSILGGRNHIWVVNNKKEKELIGVITEHDVLSILSPKKLPSYVFGVPNVSSFKHGTAKYAKDVMQNNVIGCKPDDKIIDALLKMVRYELRRLPVLDGKILIGELTLHHLIIKFYNATQYHPIVEDNKEG